MADNRAWWDPFGLFGSYGEDSAEPGDPSLDSDAGSTWGDASDAYGMEFGETPSPDALAVDLDLSDTFANDDLYASTGDNLIPYAEPQIDYDTDANLASVVTGAGTGNYYSPPGDSLSLGEQAQSFFTSFNDFLTPPSSGLLGDSAGDAADYIGNENVDVLGDQSWSDAFGNGFADWLPTTGSWQYARSKWNQASSEDGRTDMPDESPISAFVRAEESASQRAVIEQETETGDVWRQGWTPWDQQLGLSDKPTVGLQTYAGASAMANNAWEWLNYYSENQYNLPSIHQLQHGWEYAMTGLNMAQDVVFTEPIPGVDSSLLEIGRGAVEALPRDRITGAIDSWTAPSGGDPTDAFGLENSISTTVNTALQESMDFGVGERYETLAQNSMYAPSNVLQESTESVEDRYGDVGLQQPIPSSQWMGLDAVPEWFTGWGMKLEEYRKARDPYTYMTQEQMDQAPQSERDAWSMTSRMAYGEQNIFSATYNWLFRGDDPGVEGNLSQNYANYMLHLTDRDKEISDLQRAADAKFAEYQRLDDYGPSYRQRAQEALRTADDLQRQAYDLKGMDPAQWQDMHLSAMNQFVAGLINPLDPLKALHAGEVEVLGTPVSRRIESVTDAYLGADAATSVLNVATASASAPGGFGALQPTFWDRLNPFGRPAASQISQDIATLDSYITAVAPNFQTTEEAQRFIEIMANDPQSLLTGVPAQLFPSLADQATTTTMQAFGARSIGGWAFSGAPKFGALNSPALIPEEMQQLLTMATGNSNLAMAGGGASYADMIDAIKSADISQYDNLFPTLSANLDIVPNAGGGFDAIIGAGSPAGSSRVFSFDAVRNATGEASLEFSSPNDMHDFYDYMRYSSTTLQQDPAARAMDYFQNAYQSGSSFAEAEAIAKQLVPDANIDYSKLQLNAPGTLESTIGFLDYGEVYFGSGAMGSDRMTRLQPIWSYMESSIPRLESLKYGPFSPDEFVSEFRGVAQQGLELSYGIDSAAPGSFWDKATGTVQGFIDPIKRLTVESNLTSPGFVMRNALNAQVLGNIDGVANYGPAEQMIEGLLERTAGVAPTERIASILDNTFESAQGLGPRSIMRDMQAGLSQNLYGLTGYDFSNAPNPLAWASEQIAGLASGNTHLGDRVAIGEGANYLRSFFGGQGMAREIGATRIEEMLAENLHYLGIPEEEANYLLQVAREEALTGSRGSLAEAYNNAISRVSSSLTPEQTAGLREFGATSLFPRMEDVTAAGTAAAKSVADFTMLDPSVQYNFQNWLGKTTLYSFFRSQTTLNMAERLANNPELLGFLGKYYQFVDRENDQEGVPDYLRGTLPLWGGHRIYDPVGVAVPTDMFSWQNTGESQGWGDFFLNTMQGAGYMVRPEIKAAVQALSGEPVDIDVRGMSPIGRVINDTLEATGMGTLGSLFDGKNDKYLMAQKIAELVRQGVWSEDKAKRALADLEAGRDTDLTRELEQYVAQDRLWGDFSSTLTPFRVTQDYEDEIAIQKDADWYWKLNPKDRQRYLEDHPWVQYKWAANKFYDDGSSPSATEMQLEQLYTTRKDYKKEEMPQILDEELARLLYPDATYTFGSPFVVTDELREKYQIPHTEDNDNFEALPGIGPKTEQRLYDMGYKTFDDLAFADVNDLGKIPGLSKEEAEDMVDYARRKYLEEEEMPRTRTPDPYYRVMPQKDDDGGDVTGTDDGGSSSISASGGGSKSKYSGGGKHTGQATDDKDNHYLYVLVDPRNGRVMYAGQTNDPERRFAEHLASPEHLDPRHPKAAWIRDLYQNGLYPEMKVFQGEMTSSDVNDMEMAWIGYFLYDDRTGDQRSPEDQALDNMESPTDIPSIGQAGNRTQTTSVNPGVVPWQRGDADPLSSMFNSLTPSMPYRAYLPGIQFDGDVAAAPASSYGPPPAPTGVSSSGRTYLSGDYQSLVPDTQPDPNAYRSSMTDVNPGVLPTSRGDDDFLSRGFNWMASWFSGDTSASSTGSQANVPDGAYSAGRAYLSDTYGPSPAPSAVVDQYMMQTAWSEYSGGMDWLGGSLVPSQTQSPFEYIPPDAALHPGLPHERGWDLVNVDVPSPQEWQDLLLARGLTPSQMDGMYNNWQTETLTYWDVAPEYYPDRLEKESEGPPTAEDTYHDFEFMPKIGRAAEKHLYQAGYTHLDDIAGMDVDKLLKIIGGSRESAREIINIARAAYGLGKVSDSRDDLTEMPFVGEKTEFYINAMGIHTLKDLAHANVEMFRYVPGLNPEKARVMIMEAAYATGSIMDIDPSQFRYDSRSGTYMSYDGLVTYDGEGRRLDALGHVAYDHEGEVETVDVKKLVQFAAVGNIEYTWSWAQDEEDAKKVEAQNGWDDFEFLTGIGPKSEQKLYEEGVTSLAQLASMSPDDVREMFPRMKKESITAMLEEAGRAKGDLSHRTGAKESFDVNNLEQLPYVGPVSAERLRAAGFDTVDEIAAITPERIDEIAKIKGFDASKAARLIKAAQSAMTDPVAFMEAQKSVPKADETTFDEYVEMARHAAGLDITGFGGFGVLRDVTKMGKVDFLPDAPHDPVKEYFANQQKRLAAYEPQHQASTKSNERFPTGFDMATSDHDQDAHETSHADSHGDGSPVGDAMLLEPFEGNYKLTQHFGEHPENYSRFGLAGHEGVDWIMPEGTDIFSAAPGKVEKVGWDPNGYGNYVVVQHAWGGETLYAHFSAITVAEGDDVTASTVLGDSGDTGNSSAPHLHFGYRPSGQRQADDPFKGFVDPLAFTFSRQKEQLVDGVVRPVPVPDMPPQPQQPVPLGPPPKPIGGPQIAIVSDVSASPTPARAGKNPALDPNAILTANQAVFSFDLIKGVTEGMAAKIYEAGYRSMQALAYATPEELSRVPGVSDTTAQMIISTARESVHMPDPTSALVNSGNYWSFFVPFDPKVVTSTYDDFEFLPGIGKKTEERLYASGVTTLEELAALSIGDLKKIPGMTPDKATDLLLEVAALTGYELSPTQFAYEEDTKKKAARGPDKRHGVFVSRDGLVTYDEFGRRLDSLGHLAYNEDGEVETLPVGGLRLMRGRVRKPDGSFEVVDVDAAIHKDD